MKNCTASPLHSLYFNIWFIVYVGDVTVAICNICLCRDVINPINIPRWTSNFKARRGTSPPS